eukprot:7408315-Heterocapsa_arctica.AAC.1
MACLNTRTPVARVKGVRLRKPVAGRLYMGALTAGRFLAKAADRSRTVLAWASRAFDKGKDAFCTLPLSIKSLHHTSHWGRDQRVKDSTVRWINIFRLICRTALPYIALL